MEKNKYTFIFTSIVNIYNSYHSSTIYYYLEEDILKEAQLMNLKILTLHCQINYDPLFLEKDKVESNIWQTIRQCELLYNHRFELIVIITHQNITKIVYPMFKNSYREFAQVLMNNSVKKQKQLEIVIEPKNILELNNIKAN